MELVNLTEYLVKELLPEVEVKINKIDSLETLNKTKVELEDRFGTLDENIIIYMFHFFL